METETRETREQRRGGALSKHMDAALPILLQTEPSGRPLLQQGPPTHLWLHLIPDFSTV